MDGVSCAETVGLEVDGESLPWKRCLRFDTGHEKVQIYGRGYGMELEETAGCMVQNGVVGIDVGVEIEVEAKRGVVREWDGRYSRRQSRGDGVEQEG